MVAFALGVTVIAIVGSWIAGGILLRTAGLTVALLGALELAINHNRAGIALLAAGAAVWLAGHWHYALRHHYYKSPLAQRVFQQLLPRRLDPSRGWGTPVIAVAARRTATAARTQTSTSRVAPTVASTAARTAHPRFRWPRSR